MDTETTQVDLICSLVLSSLLYENLNRFHCKWASVARLLLLTAYVASNYICAELFFLVDFGFLAWVSNWVICVHGNLTARDILTMISEDLRKYVSDLDQDPKSMSKTDMQTWLIEKVVPSEAASAVEIPSMPSCVGKLTPELQLQYYLKKEE